MSTIRCFYECDCTLARRFVEVPERDPATHDVVQWLEQIAGQALGADHREKSPTCQSTRLRNVGIPVDDGTDHIGTRTRS